MRNPREDSTYRKINQLTTVQIVSLALVVLVVAVLAIVQGAELRRASRRISDLEQRITTIETGSDTPTVGSPPGFNSQTPTDASQTVDSHPSHLSRLSHGVMSLATGLGDEPTPDRVEAVTAALSELETQRVAPADLDPQVAAGVARLYLATERFEKAVEWATAALDRGAAKAATAYILAKAHYHLGRYKPAMNAVVLCTSPGGVEPAVVLLRGQVELALGRDEDGEATLTEALVLDAVAADAAVLLAKRFLERGEADRAAEVISHAETVAPNRYDIARCRAAVLLAREQYEECIETASMLLAVDEQDVPMLRTLGRALLGARQAVSATETFHSLVRLRPNDAKACDLLGQAMLAQLRPIEAAEQFIRAARLAPEDATVWHHLGVARANGDDLDAALEAFDRAIALDGGYARAHFARAVCLARGGDPTEAERVLQRALALDATLLEQAEQVDVFSEILAMDDDDSPGSGS